MEYITFWLIVSIISSSILLFTLQKIIEKYVLKSKKKSKVLDILLSLITIIYTYVGVSVLFSILFWDYQIFTKYGAIIIFMIIIPLILFYAKSTINIYKDRTSYILKEFLVLYTIVPLSISLGLLISNFFWL